MNWNGGERKDDFSIVGVVGSLPAPVKPGVTSAPGRLERGRQRDSGLIDNGLIDNGLSDSGLSDSGLTRWGIDKARPAPHLPPHR